MKQFESKWPEGFDTKISKVIETHAETKKHLKVGERKVFDTNLIYTTVIGLQTSSRDMETDRILAHMLAPVPTSMSTDMGDMKLYTAKSVLKKLLQSTVSTRHLETQISCSVIDGSAVLYFIHWPVNGMAQDYVNNFKYYISKMLQKRDVYLVFDRYKPYSTNKKCDKIGKGSTEQPGSSAV